LQGTSVLAMKDSCLDPALYPMQETGANVKLFPPERDLDEMIPSVIAGSVDTTLMDVPVALIALERWAGEIKVVGPVSLQQEMANAFDKSAPKLRVEFEKFFSACKADNTCHGLVNKYYPTVFSYYPDFFKKNKFKILVQIQRIRQMSGHENRLTVLTKKPALAIMIACLLLVSLIGFLVISNFRSQIALRDSALNRFRLDLEKRSASLGYFFSERKYDLKTLALSREINTYFTNKALGMSERYGLKVNLFMIKRVLEKTLNQKKIQEDNIYERFVFLDSSGRPLVDTASLSSSYNAISWKAIQETGERGPHVYLGDENKNPQIFVVAPCHYKGKIVGNVIAWLDRQTLFTHFVKFAKTSGLRGSGLVNDQDQLLSSFEKSDQNFASYLTSERIAGLSMADFSFESVLSDGKKREMLIARLPIHNLGLSFVAWMPSDQIVGTLAPWHLIAGMGSLAVFVLVGLALIIWFTTQNIILRVRFDESERQHDLLAAKNLRLKEEIQKRQEAEEELKAQRTLRIC